MNPPDSFIAESVHISGTCLSVEDVSLSVRYVGAKTYIGPTQEHYPHAGEEEGESVDLGVRKAFEA